MCSTQQNRRGIKGVHPRNKTKNWHCEKTISRKRLCLFFSTQFTGFLCAGLREAAVFRYCCFISSTMFSVLCRLLIPLRRCHESGANTSFCIHPGDVILLPSILNRGCRVQDEPHRLLCTRVLSVGVQHCVRLDSVNTTQHEYACMCSCVLFAAVSEFRLPGRYLHECPGMMQPV